MASGKMARCVWLIETLRGRRMDYEELNRRWVNNHINDDGEELSKRTLKRHIETAEEFFGITIKCDRHCGYVYYIDDEDSIGGNALTDWLISSYSTMNQLAADRSLQGRILFEDIPSGNNWLTTITEAMRENRVIHITHQGFGRSEASSFDVEPYCLKVFSRRWYLIARNPYYAEMNKQRGKGMKPVPVYRTYALDRIHAVEVTGRTFKLRTDFNIDEYFADCIGVIHSDKKAQRVVIKAYNSKPDYLRTLPLHPSQKEIASDDESATFEYRLKLTYELNQEIMAMQDEVEVLEPQKLREELYNCAHNLTIFYKENEI